MKFGNGDRVMYVSGSHGTSTNNPLAGSYCECVGVVTSISQFRETLFTIHVEWDNGTGNTYNESDLVLVADGGEINPNIAFRSNKVR